MSNQIQYFKPQSKKWLKFRQQYITGTDLASLFKLNPYKSLNVMMKSKTGEAKTFDNKAMRAGRLLEAGVPILVSELGYPSKLASSNKVCVVYNDEYGLSASLDAIMIKDHKKHVEEIKTTNMDNFKKWVTEGLPLYYLLQVHTQILLRPDDFESSAMIAALGGSHPDYPLALFKIVQNQEIAEIIVEESQSFRSDPASFTVKEKLTDKLQKLLPSTAVLIKLQNYLDK